MSRKLYRFIPDPDENGSRLDHFVPSRTEELSRTFFRRIVDLGGVHVGGRRVRKCSQAVREGEMVEVYLDGLPPEPYSVEESDVVFRDRYILALSKPAGVDTQPTPARYKGTVYEALLRYLRDPFRPMDSPPLGMVQRLDRDTSGIMVFSIHPKAHRELTRAFSGREVRKFYLTIVQGNPGQKGGEIRSYLARSRATNLVKSVEKGGKEAITRFRVLEEFSGSSLLEVEILTGRSHQIRVHLAESGHPLLGDVRYGGPSMWHGREIPRQMLHSSRIIFSHRVSGRTLDLKAPVSPDMERVLEILRG